MKMDVFMEELKAALVKRGVPEENAAKHAQSLRQSFDSEDLSEIEAMDSLNEINALADSLSAILLRKKKVAPTSTEQAAGGIASVSITEAAPTVRTVAVKNEEPKPIIAAIEAQQAAAEQKKPAADDEFFTVDQSTEPTSKGKAIFWCGLLVTLPVTIAVLAVIFGGFAVIFGGLIVLIAALVLAMIGLIAAGAVCSLVGIIYGVTQLFSFVAAGIYEIGLGITVAGVVLLLSVLIFNLAIRFLPFVIGKAAVFFKFVMRKLKDAFLAVRRECYKL